MLKQENVDQRFERLDPRSQARRLRRLATTALAAYDLPAVPAPRLRLLAHLYNTTFRVDTADGQRYVLRIHRAGTPSRILRPSMSRSAMRWRGVKVSWESTGARPSAIMAAQRSTDLTLA